MKEIDLRRIDLNLLVLFDVLMSERSVTRAADLLGRTQSAVSHALARLRDQVGDPLLVKRGGRMVASPFAERLAVDVRPILASIRRVLAPGEAFDPATTARAFRVALPDLNDSLFPILAQRILRLAPRATLEWAVRDDATLVAVADGLVDLALVPSSLKVPDGIAHGAALDFHWASFMRRGHPAVRAWSRSTWAKWPHVAVRVDRRIPSPVEQAASELESRRRIAVWVPHFGAVAPLLAQSDLIATLPMMVMFDRLRRFGLVALKSPLRIAPMPHRLVWSRRLDNDPGLRWLREQFDAALAEIVARVDGAMPRDGRDDSSRARI